MKKFLRIVVLGLLCCNISYAEWNNLKGIQSFKLSITHQGDCKGKNYKNDIETSIKYILANSKINLVDEKERGEYLGVELLTIGNERLCSTSATFYTYTFNFSKNSAGIQDFYQVVSFDEQSIFYAGDESNHKSQIINWIEEKTKKLVVTWSEAQK